MSRKLTRSHRLSLRRQVSAVAASIMMFGTALAHDRQRPELDSWFDKLSSQKGRCCANADGTALSDVDWDIKDGHYRVRIESQWWDVPDSAVIKEPNRAGPTMVWPMYVHSDGKLARVDIRCFMPGSMT